MKHENFELINNFLIAMPGLGDFNFNQAVVYVCAHNEEGTMGVVVNQPFLEVSLGEVLEQMNIDVTDSQVNNFPVYLGGPVQPERGFIIHTPNNAWQSTLITSSQLGVTSSKDILQSIAVGDGPDDAIVILGYAGWGAGQLEEEIAKNYWLVAQATPEILFNTPINRRWEKAGALLGIDMLNISSDVGHA